MSRFDEGEEVWVRARFVSSGFEGNARVEVYEYPDRRHSVQSHVDQICRLPKPLPTRMHAVAKQAVKRWWRP